MSHIILKVKGRKKGQPKDILLTPDKIKKMLDSNLNVNTFYMQMSNANLEHLLALICIKYCTVSPDINPRLKDEYVNKFGILWSDNMLGKCLNEYFSLENENLSKFDQQVLAEAREKNKGSASSGGLYFEFPDTSNSIHEVFLSEHLIKINAACSIDLTFMFK